MKHSIFKIFLCFGVISLLATGCKKDPNTYILTVNIAPADGGVVEVSPDLSVYEEGTKVTLTATTSDGYSFGGWTGDHTGSAETIEVVMTANKTIEARFSRMAYSLDLTVNPAEGGEIEVSPTSDGAYEHGTVVTITAMPSEGYIFTGWTGDYTGNAEIIEVVMSANKSIEAVFTKKSYRLDMTVNPAEGGEIEVSPASDGTYEHGTVVTITAKPAVGYFFSRWQGDATGVAETIEIVMNQNKTIEGSFSVGIKEDFEDDEANNFLNDESGRWSVNNKAYQMTGKGLGSSWAYSWYKDNGFNNFEYSVDITALDNTHPTEVGAGIYFRSANGNFRQNSYWLGFMCLTGKWGLIKFINGETIWLKEWISSDAINTGHNQTNTLKVSCSGSTIEVFINGINLGAFTDTEHTAGYVGVSGFDFRESTNTYAFDNFMIKVAE